MTIAKIYFIIKKNANGRFEYLNEFFKADFNISKVNICCYVIGTMGNPVHRNRANHGLVYNLAGNKRYEFLEGESYTVEPGTVFYLPKFSNYDVIDDADGACIAINFELVDSETTYPFFALDGKSYKNYQPLFREMLKRWEAKEAGYINVCFKILYEIICSVQEQANKKYLSGASRDMAQRSVKYIMEGLSRPSLSVGEIAGWLGVSAEYFRKIFRESYGTSPRKYIIERRMERARELLQSGKFRVLDVAMMCGYNDATHFSTEFKRIYSKAPSDLLN